MYKQDGFVFGDPRDQLLNDDEGNQRVLSNNLLNHLKHKSGNGGIGDSINLNPPEKRVLLLSGPPGLGKTTLAHVLAKHAGYRVVEINASDERSL